MIKDPIAISLSPNTQREEINHAIHILFRPWCWKNGKDIKRVEQWFTKYLDVQDAISFNSGRVALYALLKTFGIGKDDEVIVQAFTCVVVPNAVRWLEATPVFVDIDDTLAIDPNLLEKNISNKTKAIIVQHTFGVPAKIDQIKQIAKKHHLILIEDCAQSLGAMINGKKLGTFGDAAFFSFGRDKVISSVFGGIAVINSKSKIYHVRLRTIQRQLPYPDYYWIFQQLIHPLAFAVILPLYNIYIGKLMLLILQKIGLLSKPVYKEELEGEKPPIFPAKYPNALAVLLISQLKKLEYFNKKRKEIAAYYYQMLNNQKGIELPVIYDGAIYLRFNILTDKAEKILSYAKKRGMLLGNWYRDVIDPKGVLYEQIGYQKGSCPIAEEKATLSVNLPTYHKLTIADLDQIVKVVTT